MASTYSTNLGIEKPGLGEQSGTWGTTVNTCLDIIDRALGRKETITLSAVTYTLAITDGVLSEGQNHAISFIGSPGGDCTITITPNDAQRVIRIENSTTGGFSLIVKQGSGTTATIPNGFTSLLYTNGGGAAAAISISGGNDKKISLLLSSELAIGATYAAPSFYISGGLVNIGTKNGTAPLTISGATGISATVPLAGTLLHLSQVPDTRCRIMLDSFGTIGGLIAQVVFMGRTARGTPAAPTAIQANDGLASFSGTAYGATGYASSSRGALAIRASENWTDTAQGTFLALSVTANGTTTTADKVLIFNNGAVAINKASTASMLAVVGLAVYADRAAALAGGLTAGDGYVKADGTFMIV